MLILINIGKNKWLKIKILIDAPKKGRAPTARKFWQRPCYALCHYTIIRIYYCDQLFCYVLSIDIRQKIGNIFAFLDIYEDS